MGGAAVNYFPFHIGDYAAHTRHLSLLEDLAYRRLIDLYYTREAALPIDAAQTARLIAMRDQVAEVEVVLNEFFTATADGWIHARCDDEIAAMRAKQKAQGAKDEHEADRMRRHRERRAAMFDALRAQGITPAWDVAAKELQRLVDEASNEPATRTGALLETDVQRLSLPTPTPTPTPEEKEKPPRKRAGTPPCPDDVDATVWADWVAVRHGHKAEASATAIDAARREATKAGMAFEAFLRVWCLRGSRGLEAAWLKPDERSSAAPSEGNYARQMREKYEQAAPMVAAKKPGALRPNPMEILDEYARIAD